MEVLSLEVLRRDWVLQGAAPEAGIDSFIESERINRGHRALGKGG